MQVPIAYDWAAAFQHRKKKRSSITDNLFPDQESRTRLLLHSHSPCGPGASCSFSDRSVTNSSASRTGSTQAQSCVARMETNTRSAVSQYMGSRTRSAQAQHLQLDETGAVAAEHAICTIGIAHVELAARIGWIELELGRIEAACDLQRIIEVPAIR